MTDQSSPLQYCLAESHVNFSVVRELTTDQFDPSGTGAAQKNVATVVTLGTRASEKARTVDLGAGSSQVTLTPTPDGRIHTVSSNVKGQGGQAVAAIGKLLGVVVGVATALAGRKPDEPDRTDLQEHGHAVAPPPRPTPEELAQAEWASHNGISADLLGKYRKLVGDKASLLLALREQVGTGTSSEEAARQLSISRVVRVIDDAREQTALLEGLYAAWRRSTITTLEEQHELSLSMDELPRARVGQSLNLDAMSEKAREVWEVADAMVQVEEPGSVSFPASDHPSAEHHGASLTPVNAFAGHWASDKEGAQASAVPRITWRIPRRVTLSLWKQGRDGTPVLERRFEARVIDGRSRELHVDLPDKLFGEHEVTLEFDADGNLATLTKNESGGFAELLDALAGSPAEVAAGLESVSKAQTSVHTIADASEARRAATLARDLKAAQDDLALKGLTATFEDQLRVQKLKAQADLAAQEKAVAPAAPPSEKEQLIAEAELIEARLRRDQAQRQAALEQQIADLRAEVERLDLVNRLRKEGS